MIFYTLKATGKNQEMVIVASNLAEFAKEGDVDDTIEIIDGEDKKNKFCGRSHATLYSWNKLKNMA